jgi:glycosyltransferase involved in cell wall biosynthesis|tara:strand:+ start:39 stop:1442 length:1404 start_codon:yes stop_codon:yes gene_type:complete
MSKENKKPLILLLSDDLRLHSGIATMSKEMVLHTAHKYNWLQVGAAVKHPDEGKFFDVSDDVKKELGIDDVSVRIIPSSGYGNPELVRQILINEDVDAIIHFTDPRFWGWLYDMEDEIRKHVPIMYLNIWDDLPDPMWNAPFYGSCDLLMSISKQTYGINRRVMEKYGEHYDDWQMKYIPHGVSEKFRPLVSGLDEDYEKISLMRDKLNIPKNKNFIVLWNNRNIRRKVPGDVILSYKEFCDNLPKEEAKNCLLLLHTQPVDDNGTNLIDVIENVCPDYDVQFTNTAFSTEDLNILYNLSDVNVNIASNEGFGLSSCESVNAGVPMIVNVTGGLQDQCNFTIDGKYITADQYVELGSLHDKKKLPQNLSWGSWVNPVWPSNRSLQGSPPTPYIFDDRCSYEDVAKALRQWYDTPLERRIECGLEGSTWMKSKEAGMSAKNMGERYIEAIETTFKNWKPRKELVLWKI